MHMPAFGQTAFGQNRIWPKPHLAKPHLARISVSVFWPNFLVLLLACCCLLLLVVVVLWCVLWLCVLCVLGLFPAPSLFFENEKRSSRHSHQCALPRVMIKQPNLGGRLPALAAPRLTLF